MILAPLNILLYCGLVIHNVTDPDIFTAQYLVYFAGWTFQQFWTGFEASSREILNVFTNAAMHGAYQLTFDQLSNLVSGSSRHFMNGLVALYNATFFNDPTWNPAYAIVYNASRRTLTAPWLTTFIPSLLDTPAIDPIKLLPIHLDYTRGLLYAIPYLRPGLNHFTTPKGHMYAYMV